MPYRIVLSCVGRIDPNVVDDLTFSEEFSEQSNKGEGEDRKPKMTMNKVEPFTFASKVTL